MIRFTCSVCGKRMRAEPKFAGRRTLCRACGNKVRVIAGPARNRAGLTALVARPYARPVSASVACADRVLPLDLLVRKKPSRLALWICLPMAVVGLLVIGGLAWTLEMDRQEAVIAEANDAVAGQVEAARTLIAHHQWDEAIAALQKALTTPDATELDGARVLLREARHSQAKAILAAAEAAIQHADAAGARKLLQDYLAHPLAAEKSKALRVIDEINLVLSDSRAVALLHKLSAPAFAAFAKGGELADTSQVRNPYLRDMYVATLRRGLAKAQEMREAERLAQEKRLREEHDRRVARARTAPAFREVQELAARTRARDKRNRELMADYDGKLIEATGAVLTAADANARQALQQDAARVKAQQGNARAAIEQWKEQVEEQISKTRASVKERIRSYKEFADADCQVFNALVDAELDALLKDLKKAVKEDEGSL
jgi:hypothetical protein